MKKSIPVILSSFVFSFAMVLVGFYPASAKTGIKITEQSANYQTDDNIANFRIAVPTKSMIRKADREIHLNMYNDIRSAYQINFSPDFAVAGDIRINNQFESSYHIEMNQEQALTADDIINDLFAVDQITFNSIEQINDGDHSIGNSFFAAN
jgi:hypothetical protein